MPTLDGLAELPRVYVDTSLAATPSAGSIINVANGGDLQAALDSALPGDRIRLARGAIFAGNFILRGKTGGIAGGWITVEIDPTGGFLAEGTRLTPTDAATYNLPHIRASSIVPAMQTEATDTCQRYRFVGIEFDVDPSVTGSPSPQQGIILFGDAGSGQNSLSKVPSNLILDRCYIHGHTTLDCRRGVSFNAAWCGIVECTVQEIHSTFDCQAVTSSNGPGPHRIHNNHLEASTEVIAYGGADIWVPNMNCSDVEITKNHITKPLGQSGTWFTKNLIELKWGVRVLIEDNILEHVEAASQFSCFVLWSANADTGHEWTRCEDIVVRNNDVRTVKWFANLVDRYKPSSIVNNLARVTFRNNVCRGLNQQPETGGGISRHWSINGFIDGLWIEHNTGFADDTCFIWDGTVLTNHVVKNNLTGGGGPFAFQMFAPAGQGANAWNSVAGAGSTFLGNVVADMTAPPVAGNNFPALADVGLVGGAAGAYDQATPLTDLKLAPTSPFKGTATDGTDPGADIDALITGVAGVESGTGGGGGGPTPVLTTLLLSPSSADIQVGDTTTFTIIARDQFGAPFTVPAGLTITSTNPAETTNLQVGSTLQVTGAFAGTTQISVASGLIASNQVSVVVGAPPSTLPVASLVLGPHAVSGVIGGAVETIQVGAFDANGAPVDIPTLSFNTSNISVAQIVSVSGHTLTLQAYEAGVTHVWVSSGGIDSNRVTVLISDPTGGRSHRNR